MLTDKQIEELGIKFFQLNDYEVWVGKDIESIVKAVKDDYDSDLYDDPKELPMSIIDSDTIIDIEEKYQPRYTYRNFLEKLIDEGVTFPYLFSSTEY